MNTRCRLYLITPPRIDPAAFRDDLAMALDAGDVACVQLRLKDIDDNAVRRAAEILLPVAHDRSVDLIMNDRPDLAYDTGCDGVHIGQEDASYREARSLLGRDAIIGVTCHQSRDLSIVAADAGADYVAFGAFYRSGTKTPKSQVDPEILRWWSDLMVTPCVAIGGITVDNCPPLIATGADFLSVVAGIWDYREGPAAAVKAFNEVLETVAVER
ncbi:MAG: Thiamine-phosphate synthase [Alphaproteobacteria bacterium MarineAlpha10_Bin3]|nr:MAG: Thiamine-phosphate synthase [Alphaproteobacteria bacterium MarineAlpha10_Bin3]PPR75365.1 MAG: Thiamine-phosphate synthase [Alphaproteobacteria bacterium MarineAlpha4_Bin1]